LEREFQRRLVETVTGTSEYHLLTDGRSVYVENSARQVIDILKNSRQPIFAVCLSDTVRRITASHVRTRKKLVTRASRSLRARRTA
jgi:hypothetical protein